MGALAQALSPALSPALLPVRGALSSPVVLPSPVISLQPNAAGSLFLEATGASATSPAEDTQIADTVVDAVVADQYFTAPSEGAGPTVAVVSGVTTLACAGASSLNSSISSLTGSWTAFALVKGTNQRLFTISSDYRFAPRIISGAWHWYTSSTATSPICTGDASLWHVLMVEYVPGVSITGRYNNGGELSQSPFGATGTPGFSLFVQATSGGGNFSGSLARLDIIDGVLSNAQKTAYHNLLASLGSGLIGT